MIIWFVKLNEKSRPLCKSQEWQFLFQTKYHSGLSLELGLARENRTRNDVFDGQPSLNQSLRVELIVTFLGGGEWCDEIFFLQLLGVLSPEKAMLKSLETFGDRTVLGLTLSFRKRRGGIC